MKCCFCADVKVSLCVALVSGAELYKKVKELGGCLPSNRQPLSVIVNSLWFFSLELKYGEASRGVERWQLRGRVQQQLPPSITVFMCVCAHSAPHTHTPDGCVCLCCVEYLFDLCCGLCLIMSADRWFQVYLLFGCFLLTLALLGVIFSPL